MTSRRQVTSNRKNAAKSTGPKSNSGKARVAKTATRHRLTKRPGAEQVLAWYRLILNDQQAEIEICNPDPVAASALRLAEAEAHLHNIREAERRFSPESLFSDHSSSNVLDGEIDFEIVNPKIEVEIWDQSAGYLARNSEAERREILRYQRPFRNSRRRLLSRYRNEAESKRLKAFDNWISLVDTV